MINLNIQQCELSESLVAAEIKSPTTSDSSEKDLTRVNFEEALKLCGGFGRFQTVITILFCTCFTTGGQIINGIGFLYALPNKGNGYQCQDPLTLLWSQCNRDHICEHQLAPETWKIDYSSPNSFKNWIDPQNLNLTCVS